MFSTTWFCKKLLRMPKKLGEIKKPWSNKRKEITLDFDDAFLVFLVLAAHLFTETKKIVGSIKVAVEGQRGVPTQQSLAWCRLRQGARSAWYGHSNHPNWPIQRQDASSRWIKDINRTTKRTLKLSKGPLKSFIMLEDLSRWWLICITERWVAVVLGYW